MSGIYIHIPFCKQACHYCNFHFSTTFDSYRKDMIQAIIREIELQKEFFGSKTEISSVYFGGGTPSLLNAEELGDIWQSLEKNFDLSLLKEVTLEANPDDIDRDFIQTISQSKIDRLSIGVQSFDDLDLAYLNRVHDSKRAYNSISHAKDIGLEVSTDLIFGIPTSGITRLESDIRKLTQMDVNHISVYALTVELNTPLYHLIKRKKKAPIIDEKVVKEMSWLMDFMPSLGYHQYEISNFAAPGYEAVHNSSYWHGEKYLGIGPSAHSYDGQSRYWNISNNIKYIHSLKNGEIPCEKEILTSHDRYNEWIMTRLRLKEGINSGELGKIFGEKLYQSFLENVQIFVKEEKVKQYGYQFILTNSGRLWADYISSELFIE
ncbi:MAG: radical SAM family heme chaperone HemW [Chitinophagales bacterium]|nr:radical SAM family heme chaperone HemW [Chitinophagales bacterium]